MPKVSELFEVRYGHSLELNRLTKSHSPDAVAFVSRAARNNGIVAYVERLPNVEPAPGGELTCALSGEGGRLSTFLQDRPFYTAFHVARLMPKRPMTTAQLLYYCMCIHANRYRYSFGRQANRTLRDIIVPAIKEIPDYVEFVDTSLFDGAQKPAMAGRVPRLNAADWKPFLLRQLFDIKKGSRVTKANMKPGSTPFVSATDSNNGVRQYISLPPAHPGNTITVSYNGSVAEAFYQPEPFWASDDVNVFYPRFTLDAALALFLCTIIRREKYRFNYGRKWTLERMNESEIRLPANADGTPDWLWIGSYIQNQNFSSQLYEDEEDAQIAKRRLAEIDEKPGLLVQGKDLRARLGRMRSRVKS